MKYWLRSETVKVSEDLFAAYIFGSILNQNKLPRDVDVVFVSIDGVDMPGWCRIRAWRDRLSSRFSARFGYVLSAMVVTPFEWEEINNVVVRERETLI